MDSDNSNEKKHYCNQCGTELEANIKSFYASSSELHQATGYFPDCKKCMAWIFDVYLDRYRNARKACKRFCMTYDLYYNDKLCDTCAKELESFVPKYIRSLKISQYSYKSFDTSLKEGFAFDDVTTDPRLIEESTRKSMIDQVKEGILIQDAVGRNDIERWGAGFLPEDYEILNSHYKSLKKANPNCDSNQEIFIGDLCYIKMLQMKALKESRTDDFNKLTESYRKSFTQAGLKTMQTGEANNDDCWGLWMAQISQYTPEEYYKEKGLYHDADGIGSYFERFVLRPLRNLMHGTKDRDPEFCVKDEGDDYEYTETD